MIKIPPILGGRRKGQSPKKVFEMSILIILYV